MITSEALADASPLANDGEGALLPPLIDIASLSRKIAFAVGKVAQQQGLALETSDEVLKKAIDGHFWQPEYREYKRVSI